VRRLAHQRGPAWHHQNR